MKRLLRPQGAALVRARPCQVNSVRFFTWNPFKKKLTLEDDGVSDEVKQAISQVKQDLRKQLSKKELNELAMGLVDLPANQSSFVLLNEILRKLEQGQYTDLAGSKEPVNAQLPPLATDDAYKIFKTVINHIDTENFKAARFVPRLYLQLSQSASNSQDDVLLMQVFHDFITYLSKLGYEEQLAKVAESFLNEHGRLSQKSLDTLVLVLWDKKITPVLSLKLLELTRGGNTNQQKLHSLVLRSIDHYLSQRNVIYAIDQSNLNAIKAYIQESISAAHTPQELSYFLGICQGRKDLEEEETSILSKSIQYLLNNEEFQLKNEDSLQVFIHSLIKNGKISADERIIAGNILTKPFKGNLELEISWITFREAKLTEKLKTLLIANKNLVNEETYTSIIESLAFSNQSQDSFQQNLKEVDEFFSEHFEDIERSVKSYTYLLERGIRLKDIPYLKTTFENSLNDGIEWENSHEPLYELLYIIAQEPNADVKEVFSWYKKVKVFVKYFDSKSYNLLVQLLLRNQLIGDVATSFSEELPPLEKDTKFSVSHYPELFQSLYEWLLNYDDAEVSWELFLQMQYYFHFPFYTYLPIMKKFAKLGRPDASFLVFQTMKKIHKTTGSIPPPTPEIYSYLFKVFGEELYEDGVKDLHMLMKLDMGLNTNIDVMNSLLGAYCNLQVFFKTHEIFDSITSMPRDRGLNNETLSIMLKINTYVSLSHVLGFWNNIYEYDMLPNEDNYKQFIIAHCYHGQYDQALSIASSMHEYDLLVTPEIIESLYNWTKGDDAKLKVEQWAETKHKLIWNNIKQKVKAIEAGNKENDEEENLETKLLRESSV